MPHANIITSLIVPIGFFSSSNSQSAFLKSINVEFPSLTCLHLHVDGLPYGPGSGALSNELCNSLEYLNSSVTLVRKDGSEDSYKKRKLNERPRKLNVTLNIPIVVKLKPEIISQLKDVLSGTKGTSTLLEFGFIEVTPDAKIMNYLQKRRCGIESVKRFEFHFRSIEEIEKIEFINRIVGLKDLFIRNWFSDRIFEKITVRKSQLEFSNPTVEKLTLDLRNLSISNFNFAKLNSLKALSFCNCDVSDEILFSSIPDSVKILNIDRILFGATSIFEMKLPIFLRELTYHNYYPFKFPLFTNVKDLKSLSSVKIKFCLYAYEKMNPISNGLLQFILDLPSSVTTLSFISLGNSPSSTTSGNTILTFRFPPNLEQLTLTTKELFSNIDLSLLPSSLRTFKGGRFLVILGKFPLTLVTMSIDVYSNALSFAGFWSRFLLTLPNLKGVTITVNPRERIDFRSMKFPKHLYSLSMHVPITGAVNEVIGGIILDGFPSKLEFWG
ncbi:unnamed protein product [Ambrosiozyma monospora]|uniref:Unnamed protein product n=1 Tax=Ambrosiozyma monospora TaxID=43982 RepID=A0ACB5SYA7_AMBMO|nr:unnamed protein product [Ambrosiozyma monospora]